MSQFKRDMTEKMRDPEYAYEFGRFERELEIIKLLEEEKAQYESIGGSIFYEVAAINKFIALIKGENK